MKKQKIEIEKCRKLFRDSELCLKKLISCKAFSRSDSTELPQKPGIYLLLKNNCPIYVGRTKNIRKRIHAHSRPSSTHFSASFAFILAKIEAKKAGIRCDRSREELCNHPRFKRLFRKAREDVASMKIKFIEMENSELQAVFEVVAAVALKTPFNSFHTH